MYIQSNPLGLSEQATQIANERKDYWEFMLFGQIISDEINYLKRDTYTEISDSASASEQSTPVLIDSPTSFISYLAWQKLKLQEHVQLMAQFSNILSENHDDAFGPPGHPGDSKTILEIAKKIRDIYITVIAMSNEIRTHNFEVTISFLTSSIQNKVIQKEIFDKLSSRIAATQQQCVSAFIKFQDQLLDSIAKIKLFFELYGPEILQRIHHAEIAAKTAIPYSLNLKVEFKYEFDINKECEYACQLFNELSQEIMQLTIDTEAKNKIIEEAINFEATDNFNLQNCGPASGYVYLLMNPSIPGLIKIGKTRRTPDERVRELGAATGVPTPFTVVYEIFVLDCHQAEKYVHKQLDDTRTSPKREFFKVSSKQAIDVMLEAKALFN